MNKVALIGLSVVVGIGMGTLLDRNLLGPSHAAMETGADGISPSAPLQGASSTPSPSDTTVVSIGVEPLRAMIREEMALALTKAQAGPDARSAAPQAAPAPQASAEQQRQSLQAVDTLMTGGHWGNEERNTFHQKLALLDPQQREQAMQQLMQALNSGALKVATDGPPF